LENILTIKERILYLAKLKGFTNEDFCKKIDISYGNLKGEAKKTPINSNSIANIFAIIPDLNLEWLITGKGKVIKGYYNDISKNILNEPASEFNSKNCQNCEILQDKLKKEEELTIILRARIDDLNKLIDSKDEIIMMQKAEQKKEYKKEYKEEHRGVA
jgi:hypothetical protein